MVDWARMRSLLVHSEVNQQQRSTSVPQTCPRHFFAAMPSKCCILVLLSLLALARSEQQHHHHNNNQGLLAKHDADPAVTAGSNTPSSCPQVWTELAAGEGGTNDDEGDAASASAALFKDLSLVLHRNGEPDPCGVAPPMAGSVAAITRAMRALNVCGDGSGSDDDAIRLSKYETEAVLTELFLESLGKGECSPTDDDTAPRSLQGYCDMGPQRTVVQPDSKYLVKVPSTASLPCRFFTREGEHVDSLATLARLAREAAAAAAAHPDTCQEESCDAAPGPALHLYAVPAGRLFMYAPSYVGERFVLDRMQHSAPSQQPIVLEVLSTDPKVFEVHNFYSAQEAAELVDQALGESSESHKFHRSTTGAVNGQVFSKRTSENAWLTHTDLAQSIKRYAPQRRVSNLHQDAILTARIGV
jgi:hypothetical protein